MRFFFAFTTATAALLISGCGAPSSLNAPTGLIPATAGRNIAELPGPFGDLPRSSGERERSWMSPEAAQQTLLYVSDVSANAVFVYDYKQGTRVGQITSGLDQPGGECVDKHGDVFVTNTKKSNIMEFAHGKPSPQHRLFDDGYLPIGCSVDPVTGNVAVTNYTTASSSHGSVVVYRAVTGQTQQFVNSMIFFYWFCAFDNKGNLFVDGEDQGANFELAELPRGSVVFRNITLNQHIDAPGGVAWSHNTLIVGDEGAGRVYRFKVNGTKGTETGSTTLAQSSQVFQFTIAGKTIVGPDSYNNSPGNVRFWKYPAGGDPTETLGGLEFPVGTAISKAK